jgi:hypothetical protein
VEGSAGVLVVAGSAGNVAAAAAGTRAGVCDLSPVRDVVDDEDDDEDDEAAAFGGKVTVRDVVDDEDDDEDDEAAAFSGKVSYVMSRESSSLSNPRKLSASASTASKCPCSSGVK